MTWAMANRARACSCGLAVPHRALPPAVECAAGRAAGLLVEFFCAVNAGRWHGATTLHKILGDVSRQLGRHMGEPGKKRHRGHDLSVNKGGRRACP